MPIYNHWKAWALLRDGEFYRAYATKKDALNIRDNNRPGSKHRWRVVRVLVKAKPGL